MNYASAVDSTPAVDLDYSPSSSDSDSESVPIARIPDNMLASMEGKYFTLNNKQIGIRFAPWSTFLKPDFEVVLLTQVGPNTPITGLGGLISDVPSRRRSFWHNGVRRTGESIVQALGTAFKATMTEAQHDVHVSNRTNLSLPHTVLFGKNDITKLLSNGGLGFLVNFACTQHCNAKLQFVPTAVPCDASGFVGYIHSGESTEFQAIDDDNPYVLRCNFPDRSCRFHCHQCAPLSPVFTARKQISLTHKQSKKVVREMPATIFRSAVNKDLKIATASVLRQQKGLINKRDRDRKHDYLDLDLFGKGWAVYNECCGPLARPGLVLDHGKHVTVDTLNGLWMHNPISVMGKRIQFVGVLNRTMVNEKCISFLQPFSAIPIQRSNGSTPKERVYTFPHVVNYHTYCVDCTAFLLGVPATQFGGYARDVRTGGEKTSIHAAVGRIESLNLDQVRHFLEKECRLLGQALPNRTIIKLPFTSVTELTLYLKWKYNSALKELTKATLTKVLSQPYFSKLEVNGSIKQDSFTRCGTCESIIDTLRKSGDPDHIKKAIAARNAHRFQIRTDRTVLFDHNYDACTFPCLYWTLQMDGMDTAKTKVPHNTGTETHDLENTMPIHVAGFYSCGAPIPLVVFCSTPHIPHNANQNVTQCLKWLQLQTEQNQTNAKKRQLAAEIGVKQRAMILANENREDEMNVEEKDEDKLNHKCVFHSCNMITVGLYSFDAHLRLAHSIDKFVCLESPFYALPVHGPGFSLFQSLYQLEGKFLKSTPMAASFFYSQFISEALIKPETTLSFCREHEVDHKLFREEAAGIVRNYWLPGELSLQAYAEWRRRPLNVYTIKKGTIHHLQRLYCGSGHSFLPTCLDSEMLPPFYLRFISDQTNSETRNGHVDILVPAADLSLMSADIRNKMAWNTKNQIDASSVESHAWINGVEYPVAVGHDKDLEAISKAEEADYFVATEGEEELSLLDPVIKKKVQMESESSATRKQHPRILNIHCDGSSTENKNWTIFLFFALLVLYGHFDAVHFYFPQVGHSHDYVDQIFSRIAALLARTAAYTLKALIRVIVESWRKLVGDSAKVPIVKEVVDVVNFDEWIGRLELNPNHSGIRGAYVFKICSEIEVHTVVHMNDAGVKETKVVNDKVVKLHARHTAISYSPNFSKTALPTLEYEPPISLFSWNDVNRKFDTGEVSRDPTYQARRKLVDPTNAQLKETIKALQTNYSDFTAADGEEWNNWFQLQEKLDMADNVSCEECQKINVEIDALIQAQPERTKRGDSHEAKAAYKIAHDSLLSKQHEREKHFADTKHRIADGWWTKRNIPLAGEYYSDYDRVNDENKEDYDYTTKRTQNGLCVYPGLTSLLHSSTVHPDRKYGLRDDTEIKVNDIVVANAKDTDDQSLSLYPCFWVGQVINIISDLVEVKSKVDTSESIRIVQSKNQNGVESKYVSAKRYKVQWFERFCPINKKVSEGKESKRRKVMENSSNNSSNSSGSGCADREMWELQATWWGSVNTDNLLEQCKAMTEWKYIMSIDYGKPLDESWWKECRYRRPIQGKEPFICSNWGRQELIREEIIAVGSATRETEKNKYQALKQNSGPCANVNFDGDSFERVPENLVMRDYDPEIEMGKQVPATKKGGHSKARGGPKKQSDGGKTEEKCGRSSRGSKRRSAGIENDDTDSDESDSSDDGGHKARGKKKSVAFSKVRRKAAHISCMYSTYEFTEHFKKVILVNYIAQHVAAASRHGYTMSLDKHKQ